MKARKPKENEHIGYFGEKDTKGLDRTGLELELPDRKLRNVTISKLEVRKKVYLGNQLFWRVKFGLG